ncbi:MAG: leucine-rich repeat domain-containing protein [Leptolyngbya sp. SIO3F4]|nr:leucine-rich repeat domain-containing protein [Leptolyngbya sp. SIO3F4]
MFFLNPGYGQEEGYEQYTVYESLDSALLAQEPVHYLDLSGQKLKSVPPKVFTLTELKVLILRKNRIEEIPEELGALTNLEVLDISKTRLVSLPASIGNLVQLRELRVQRTYLSAIPEEIGNLVELRRLVAWDTALEEFPETLNQCVNLQYIDLRRVQISREDQDFIRSAVPKEAKLHMSAPCACD